MRKAILTLLLYGTLAQVLTAQVGSQGKLLAAHHILQQFTYTCLVDQGRLTGDSTLVEITRYNPAGRIDRVVNLDPYQPYPAKRQYEYAADTQILKVVHYDRQPGIPQCYC
ncbi:MAG: hypothetical protein ABIO24_10245 [Saprospiraceae bacterium]